MEIDWAGFRQSGSVFVLNLTNDLDQIRDKIIGGGMFSDRFHYVRNI